MSTAREMMRVIDQTYREGYLPAGLDSPKARVLMLAITRQESRWLYRDQLEANGKDTIPGPAMGLGQFERGGGVTGVMTHRASRTLAQAAVKRAGVAWNAREVWLALETNDQLAMAFVRLLLLTDPAALPAVGAVADSWDYYLRNWRPGAFTFGTPAKRAKLRSEWSENYRHAMHAFEGGS